MSDKNTFEISDPIRKTGGFIVSGLVGLFTGAIIFSVAYKLFLFWIEEQKAEKENI